jgi:hypothetical protein
VEVVEEAIGQAAAGVEADLPDVVGDRASDTMGFINILAAATSSLSIRIYKMRATIEDFPRVGSIIPP